jgi:hypothetical protein
MKRASTKLLSNDPSNQKVGKAMEGFFKKYTLELAIG